MNKIKQKIKDIESLPIEEWSKKYPYYYQWLLDNGFRYNEKLDINLMKKRHLSTLPKAKELNSDFSKDQIKELKSRRDELRKHPERGIKLEDL